MSYITYFYEIKNKDMFNTTFVWKARFKYKGRFRKKYSNNRSNIHFYNFKWPLFGFGNCYKVTC